MAQDERSTMLHRRDLLGWGALGATLALGGSPAWATVRAAPAWPQTTAILSGYVRSRRLPGVIAAIGRGQAAPELIARGTIATNSRRTVDGDTLWRIYSMTKPITGMATMLLVEDGRLTLDQPLHDILPAFREMQVLLAADGPVDRVEPARAPITIRQLLTHTAGLGYSIIQRGPIKAAYEAAGVVSGRVSRIPFPGIDRGVNAPSLAAFADALARLPLVYQPGTRWSYSVSLDLLGRVIEVVAGMPFDRFLSERLFQPLGMTSTWFRVPEREAGRLSSNYAPVGGFLLPLDPGPASVFLDAPSMPFGGSGLVSSARDYDRFLHMLMNEGTLGRTRVMAAATARLGMSDLLPAGISTAGTLVGGHGFGAGARVYRAGAAEGEGVYGWGGAAGTVAFVDRRRQLRFGGYANYMPSDTYDFMTRLPQGLLQDLRQ